MKKKRLEKIFSQKRKDLFTTYIKTILTANLLLLPLQGNTEGVKGALLGPGGERLPPTCVKCREYQPQNEQARS